MRLAALATAIGLVLASTAHAQVSLEELLARAGAYVESFQRNFGSVVAEERYEQTIRRAPGSNTTSVQRGGERSGGDGARLGLSARSGSG